MFICGHPKFLVPPGYGSDVNDGAVPNYSRVPENTATQALIVISANFSDSLCDENDNANDHNGSNDPVSEHLILLVRFSAR